MAQNDPHGDLEVRAELRAHTSALNALRQTQVEFGARLGGLEGKVDAGFAEMRTEIRAGFSAITGLLENLADDGEK